MTTDDGIRWHVLRGDLRTLGRRAKQAFRTDWTVWLLLTANVAPLIELLRSGEPVAAILVIYWLQMMIIGFWNSMKLVVMSRWLAVVHVPLFLLMYLSIVNIFGIMAGALLDDQMRGTAWHDGFSLWNYWWPGLLFFVNHGVSFVVYFVREREFEHIKWDAQLGKPILRAMPMWLAALAGAFIGGFFEIAAVMVLTVVPMKIALDLLGHFNEHGLLDFDDE